MELEPSVVYHDSARQAVEKHFRPYLDDGDAVEGGERTFYAIKGDTSYFEDKQELSDLQLFASLQGNTDETAEGEEMIEALKGTIKEKEEAIAKFTVTPYWTWTMDISEVQD